MKLRPRTVVRVLLFASMLLIGGRSHSSERSALPDGATTPLAKLPPEVRLRKLHLVRPDLIQYPICYEVYC